MAERWKWVSRNERKYTAIVVKARTQRGRERVLGEKTSA